MSKEEIENEPLVNEEENIDIKTTEEADAEAEAVENEFDLLQEELTSLKDKYARVHADFENIKKRLEKESGLFGLQANIGARWNVKRNTFF